MGNAKTEKGKTYRLRLREAVFRKSGYRCVVCRNSGVLTLDHIIPKCQGGRSNYDNLQALCPRCNQQKDDGQFVFAASKKLA